MNDTDRIRSNLPKLYVYSFFQMFLVIIPVIVPFWQQKGLSLQQIFTLQGIFGAALIAFDGPAGYLADFFGRKRAMVMGSLISALGFQILWFGQSFLHFAIYELILGIGLSLQSGCDVAILYNSLEKLNLSGRKAGYLGRRLTALTIGEGVASLLGGALASIDLNWPAYANAVTGWIPVVAALFVYEPEGQRLPRGSHLENFKSIGRAAFAHSRLLTLILISFIFYGFATFCAVWSFQPYWKDRGLGISTFGWLWAANCFLVALIGRFAHQIEEKIGSVAVVVLISVLPVIGYLGMGWTPGLWGIGFAVAFPICRGINQVIFQDAINTRVPAEMRATVNSIGSLGLRALFIVFGPLIGATLDTQGPDAAMRTLGWVYLAGFFIVAVPLLRERRGFRVS